MGWASGSDIFDAVCEQVVLGVRSQGLEEGVATEILTALIRKLQDHGWDCEAESLGLYQDWTFVHKAFANQGVALDGREDEDEA